MDALTHFLPLASVVGFRGHCNQAQLPQADGVSRGRAQLSLVGKSLTGVSLPIFLHRQPDSASSCWISAAWIPRSAYVPQNRHHYGLTQLLPGDRERRATELAGLYPAGQAGKGQEKAHKARGPCKFHILFSSPAVLKLLKHLI